VPLCSDAYSSWNSDNDERIRDQHNQEVTDATHRLYNEVIPEFARALDTNDPSMQHLWDKLRESNSKAEMKLAIKWTLGKQVLHQKGINLRHLGFIRSHLQTERLKNLILIFCVARVIKDQLREMMRKTMMEARVPSDNPFKADVIELFNTVLGHSKSAAAWWTTEVRNRIAEKYVKCLTEEEQRPDYDLRSKIDFRIMFLYLLSLTGVKLKTKAMEHLMQNTKEYRFVTSDLKSLDAKLSTGYEGPFADALKLYKEATAVKLTTSDETVRMLDVSVSKFRKAHEESPTCAIVVHRWAKAQTALGTVQPSMRDKHFGKVMHLYEKARMLWPGYISGLTDFARFIRDHYIVSIEAAQPDKVAELQKKASELDAVVATLSQDIGMCYRNKRSAT